MPGVVRFDDADSLPRLVEDQGLTVVERDAEPSRVIVLARTDCTVAVRTPVRPS